MGLILTVSQKVTTHAIPAQAGARSEASALSSIFKWF
jgi:hypothetical protein